MRGINGNNHLFLTVARPQSGNRLHTILIDTTSELIRKFIRYPLSVFTNKHWKLEGSVNALRPAASRGLRGGSAPFPLEPRVDSE